jgi:hypothetical protein
VKTQTKARLLDIAEVNPPTVSELLKTPLGKKCFRFFYEARASELAEYRADLANKCTLMEGRLNVFADSILTPLYKEKPIRF